jgi:simple sugar transport system substrate-binding protein
MGGDSVRMMVAGLFKAAKEVGYTEDPPVISAEGDMARHSSNIETLANKGVQYIMIVGGDPRALEPAIAYAHKRGSWVISVDAGIQQEGCLSNVTCDNVAIGKTITEVFCKAIGYKGNIIASEEPMYWACRERVKGRNEIFAKYPDIKIVGTITTEYPNGTQQALDQMQNFLTANPGKGSIVGVWADHDLAAVGATLAIIESGRDKEGMVVTAVDADKLSCFQYISKGTPFIASIAMDLERAGYESVKIALDHYNKVRDVQAIPKLTIVPHILVDKTNVEAFMKNKWPNE